MFAKIDNQVFIGLLGAVILLGSVVQAQTTWYVDDNAPYDPGPGQPAISDPAEDGSAAHPFDAIQEAVDAAQNDDAVLVAAGTYTGLGNRDLDFSGKAITVRSTDPTDPSVVASTLVDCEQAGRGFVFQSGETSAAVLDGLTISNGVADRGAGIFCSNASRPTIRNCMISGCVATISGGGIGANHAIAQVGGLTLVRCTITGNEGGGISTIASDATIEDCEISSNLGGGIDSLYGDVHIVRDSVITANNGTGISIAQGAAVELIRCTIIGNTSAIGAGGVRTSAGNTVVIRDCLIADNEGVHGGGVHHGPSFGAFELRNSTLASNTATQSGGGLRIAAADALAHDSVLWGNNAPDGSELLLDSGFNHPAILSVEYGVVAGGQAGASIHSEAGATSQLIWGTGNVVTDPAFVDPEGGDYHLAIGSPAINAGDPYFIPAEGEADFEGDPRVIGTRVDIGADEFRLVGDVDADCDVDISDLAQFLAHYGTSSGAGFEDGDFDGDADVDLSDLADLLAVYGSSCDS